MAVTDVKRKVETVFTIKDRASSAAGMLSRNMKSVGASIGGVLKVLNPLNVALGSLGLGLATAGVAKLGSSFEQTQMQMAGFLTALGVTSDFTQGLRVAEASMERIRIAAAALPGDAKDYIEIFRAGLPALQGAVGGTLQEMEAFSNRFAAITNTLGVDSMQAARDMALMLRSGVGGAGSDVRSFMVLMPFMRTIEGHANLTAKAFNEMTQPQRANLLSKAFMTLQPMLDHAANTFDAIWGGFKSNFRTIMRLGTFPLFKGMASVLKSVNAALYDASGQMTPLAEKLVHIGTLISKGIGGAFGFAIEQAKKLGAIFDKIAASPAGKSFKDMLNRGIGAAQENPSGAAAAGGGALAVLMGASGPIGLLVAGLIDFGTRTEAVSGVLDELSALGMGLIAPLGTMSTALLQVSGLIGDVLEGALGGFVNMLSNVVTPLMATLGLAFFWVGDVINKMRPAFMLLWTAAGNLFRSIGTFLNPILRILGSILIRTFRVLSGMFVPAIKWVIGWLAKLVEQIAWVIDKLGWLLGIAADEIVRRGNLWGDADGASNKDKAPTQDYLAKMMELFKMPEKGSVEEAAGGMASPTAPKARGGGGRSVNDFRYSRFTIDQKFAEGFDPDRVAVAFAQDLGKIGEQRLQSGFEPLFSLA